MGWFLDDSGAMHQINMVIDHHELADVKSRIQTAGSVRSDQKLRPHGLHDSNAVGRSERIVALVEMSSTSHHDDGSFAQVADYELTHMACR
jgi:hypothetical protein